MKKIDDLIASVQSIHGRYSAGRMERETVREWVLGLGGYPSPFAEALSAAMDWFRGKHDLDADALKARDLAMLKAIVEAGEAQAGKLHL
jgi:hypothetical protein